MSDKIESPFLTKPLTLLLIILVILLIFCFMKAFFYKSQQLIFDSDSDRDSHSDSHSDIHSDIHNPKLCKHNIKHNIIMLNKIIEDSKKYIKEKFEDISNAQAQFNLENLDILSDNIDKIENKGLEEIQKTIENVKNQRIINKEKILDVLTNIYILRYLEIINKGTAASYHEFIKYQNPKENKYYKQYL